MHAVGKGLFAEPLVPDARVDLERPMDVAVERLHVAEQRRKMPGVLVDDAGRQILSGGAGDLVRDARVAPGEAGQSGEAADVAGPRIELRGGSRRADARRQAQRHEGAEQLRRHVALVIRDHRHVVVGVERPLRFGIAGTRTHGR